MFERICACQTVSILLREQVTKSNGLVNFVKYSNEHER